ncbi:DUF4307 domain-containing protein [Microbacterium imperiale]|uniref:Uncharacterized protein n=1 Tax=Microbacterium imperiale TaxID=33884 RepID=A0A9W6HGJ1_9MICO|nr:DUF4307 domain-containing protein [Microbacterium imperiale]MBP2419260.1 hypothetical protein [Microbacterium imperiale]MDS0198868.1 DUF4307 domain-containing protein [Microbacterium imperiale]BFE39603.1 hypothetical protein GCM10017544_05590 [Microbacterium imperiale]GLJ79422.1 hypothetical protein GCM10017586_11040 [Microbacterium imperiale]
MSTQLKLDNRYGRTRDRRSRRIAIASAGVVGAALLALVAWTTVSSALGSVDTDATGFEVVDEHEVVVSFQVSGAADKPLACALEAQDTEHGVVGWRIVEYPADGGLRRAFTETIPTTALATNGLVTSCWIP